eukprot:TRINITY_DN3024_c1_g1_i2.p1 TRINITY_DN3024_c1_g1~~TRINITY_DN3024_c1_g1_i2.p1  ORF type:complete len:408 (+),score=206.93 TRINITY_DN3024_c1_g1_i2:54-1226(+)
MGNVFCGGETTETQLQCYIRQLGVEGKSLPKDIRDLEGWSGLGLGDTTAVVENEKLAEFMLGVLKRPEEVSVSVGALGDAELNKMVDCLKGMAVLENHEGTKLLRLYTKKEYDDMHKPQEKKEEEKKEEEKKDEQEKKEEEKKEEEEEQPNAEEKDKEEEKKEDGTEEKKEEEKPEEPKYKHVTKTEIKKHRKDVSITVETVEPKPMDADDYNKSLSVLAAIQKVEDLKKEAASAKNELESYIYWVKFEGILDNNAMQEFITEEDKTAIETVVEEVTEWVEYGEGSSDSTKKSEYVDAKKKIQEKVSVVTDKKAAKDAEERKALEAELKAKLEEEKKAKEEAAKDEAKPDEEAEEDEGSDEKEAEEPPAADSEKEEDENAEEVQEEGDEL